MKQRKLAIATVVLVIIAGCDKNENRTQRTENPKTSPDTIPTQSSKAQKIELRKESPPMVTCTQNLGNMRMDVNGDPVGKKQPVKVVGAFLKSDTCDFISVSYSLTGSYGDPIEIRVEYDKSSEKLIEIYTSSNVRNEFTGVNPKVLEKFSASGKKSWSQISEYADVKYDFNNREMTKEVGEGPKPKQSEWDGGVAIVEKYIKDNAKNSSSIKFIEWSEIIASNGFWVVKCKFSGQNSFNATVESVEWFYIKNENVVKTKPGA